MPALPRRIPGAAFASNAHAGAFVLALCADARGRRGEDPRAALLIVKKVGRGWVHRGWAQAGWISAAKN